MKTGLKAGAGKAVITPPIGTILVGYAPGRPGTSVNDDLTVTAIALEYGDVRTMLVSATICLFKTSLSDRIRGEIGKATGIRPENVILSATHTHSGPMTFDMPGWSRVNEEYTEQILMPGAIRAATDAVASLKPALLGIGTVHSEVGINRRQIEPNGDILLGQNPWAMYDPTMTVLHFKGVDGSPIANLIHYCAHCTAAGKSPEITRDWPGPMIDKLELESGAVTAFFNGAEGDVGPRLTNGQTVGDIELTMELGKKAAIDAIQAFRNITEYNDVPVQIATGTVKLPYLPLPDLETAELELKKLGDPSLLEGMDCIRYEKWKETSDIYTSDKPHRRFQKYDQTLVAIGPVVFIPFPFEMFVEITLRLRAYSHFAHTLCLSNTNGCSIYLPSQDQICRGGYEIDIFRAYGAYTLTNDVDNHVIQENMKILGELKCTE
jgi:hypothetical protein